MAGVDKISTLSNDLAFKILSLLSMKEIARTAVLSKRWQALWLSFPVHVFDERWFQEMGDDAEELSRNRFNGYLRRSFSSRHFADMQELCIITCTPHDDNLKHLVSRWVAKAIMHGQVKKLHLRIANRGGHFYVLPRAIFSSGSCLVDLELEECDVEGYRHNKVSFPLLKFLKLGLVHATCRQLDNIIRNCPELETLILDSCHGFETLKVSNPNVRNLAIKRCLRVKAFEMDAPRLNYFECDGNRRMAWDYDFDHYCTEIVKFQVLNENNICSLETLVLSSVDMNDETFGSMLSKFRSLNTLKLVSSWFGKMPLSTVFGKLKLVEVQNCHFNDPMEVNAPNLETFVYRDGHRQCQLKHFGGKGFCNIKTLSISGYLGLTTRSLEDLLSSCFHLENLNLKSCPMLGYLKVVSSTLKTLTVHSCVVLKGEIYARQLEYFQCVGKVMDFSFIFASYDLEAEFHLESQPNCDIDQTQLINLKKLLAIFGPSRSVLTIISNNSGYVKFPEGVSGPRRKTRLRETSFVDILSEIFSKPFCHETLWINLGDTTIELKFQFQFEEGARQVHDCVQEHLTGVRFENFDGINQLELLTYLLGKAKLLQFMFISFADENPLQPPFDRSVIMNRLVNSPKASQNAQVIFKENVLRNFLV